jgi:hypothetical protein
MPRGGRRKGAGRKPIVEDQEAFTLAVVREVERARNTILWCRRTLYRCKHFNRYDGFEAVQEAHRHLEIWQDWCVHDNAVKKSLPEEYPRLFEPMPGSRRVSAEINSAEFSNETAWDRWLQQDSRQKHRLPEELRKRFRPTPEDVFGSNPAELLNYIRELNEETTAGSRRLGLSRGSAFDHMAVQAAKACV